MGLNKHRGLVPALVIEALANLSISVALAGPYGIVGVAIGTTLPRLAVTLLYIPWYVRSVMGLPILEFLNQTLLRPSLAMVPFGLASYATEVFWPAGNLWIYFGQVLLALPLAALGGWFVALPRSDRRSYAGEIRRFVKARSRR